MLRHALSVASVGLVTLLLIPGSAAGLPVCSEPLATPGGAAGEALFSPGNDPQAKVCIYICSWWFNTGPHWGMGADCNAAYNNLSSLVGAEAFSTGSGLCTGAGAISYCGFDVAITGSCHWDAEHSMYVTDGYGKIKCKDWC